MATAVKRKLSESSDGRPIKVAATATAGTLIHTAVSGTTAGTYDEIWLWAYNGHTDVVTLTMEVGGATVPDNVSVVTLAPKVGWVPIYLGGQTFQNGIEIRAFASVANVVTLMGSVNRMTD